MHLSLRQLAHGALRLRLPSTASLRQLTSQISNALEVYEPTTAWDPPQIIGQMVTLQVAHYLFLACCSVILLSLFSTQDALRRDGGAFCLAMLLDWHEWKSSSDWKRGWILATSWLITCMADTQILSFLVRRPVLLLDHGSTLYVLHLIFTIYYSQSVPQSLLWWITMTGGAAGTIIIAEKVCIDREMNTSLAFGRQINTRSSMIPNGHQKQEELELMTVSKGGEEDGKAVVVDIVD